MLAPCEEIYRFYIPAIKAQVIRTLWEGHGMTQVQIAQCLGMTQAAVSKSLSGRHSKNVVRMMEREDVKEFSDRMVKQIASRRMKKEKLSEQICEHCSKVNFDGKACKIKMLVNFEKVK